MHGAYITIDNHSTRHLRFDSPLINTLRLRAVRPRAESLSIYISVSFNLKYLDCFCSSKLKEKKKNKGNDAAAE